MRETLDYKTLLKKVEYVGYKDSARFSEITVKEYENYKRTYWDAFSNQPKLFGSGYNEYTIGMQKSSSKDFTGLYRGTLTISSFGSNIYITYTGSSATNKMSTLKIIKDSFDKKKNPEMVKGINTAKNYVAGVSLAVSAPALMSGQAGVLGYAGAASDVDQLTNTTEKLTENYPKAKVLINGAKLTVDIMSMRGNFSELLNLNSLTSNKATSTLQETIIGVSNTTGDSQEIFFND